MGCIFRVGISIVLTLNRQLCGLTGQDKHNLLVRTEQSSGPSSWRGVKASRKGPGSGYLAIQKGMERESILHSDCPLPQFPSLFTWKNISLSHSGR